MSSRCVVADQVVKDAHVSIDCLQELLFVLLEFRLKGGLSCSDFLANSLLHLRLGAL